MIIAVCACAYGQQGVGGYQPPYNSSSGGSGGGGGTPGFQPNQILSGCGIEYTSGLSFTVGACNYSIGGTNYSSPLTNITLSAADPTNPRIDVIGVNTSSVVVVLTGTPAGTPAAPTVDPSTQLQLTFVQVAANATTPTGVAETVLFDEGTGGPGEWNATYSSNLALSTSNPYHLTHDIEATSAVAGNNFSLSIPSGTANLSTYNTLTLYIRNKPQSIPAYVFTWQRSGLQVGSAVYFYGGLFAVGGQNTSYQQVSIPLTLFGTGSNPVDTLVMTVKIGQVGFYMDEITLQSGLPSSPLPTTLMNFKGTWASTTAYNVNDVVVGSSGVGYVALKASTNVAVTTASTWQPLGTTGATTNQNIRTVGAFFDGGGSAVTAITRCRVVDYGGTIQSFTMIGDQSGTATVTVKTVAFGSYTGPASTSDISNGGETVTTAVKLQDTTLTGWTTSFSSNTAVCFVLSAPSGFTWLEAHFKIAAN